MGKLEIRELVDADRGWSVGVLRERWAGPMIERLGELVDASALPGFVAWDDSEPVGLITFLSSPRGLEVVTLDSLAEGRGIGSALMKAVEDRARSLGSQRVFLFTSNDNLHALGFYQRRGYRLVAIHRDAMVAARILKPQLPLVGSDGIPLLDEIELEKRL